MGGRCKPLQEAPPIAPAPRPFVGRGGTEEELREASMAQSYNESCEPSSLPDRYDRCYESACISPEGGTQVVRGEEPCQQNAFLNRKLAPKAKTDAWWRGRRLSAAASAESGRHAAFLVFKEADRLKLSRSEEKHRRLRGLRTDEILEPGKAVKLAMRHRLNAGTEHHDTHPAHVQRLHRAAVEKFFCGLSREVPASKAAPAGLYPRARFLQEVNRYLITRSVPELDPTMMERSLAAYSRLGKREKAMVRERRSQIEAELLKSGLETNPGPRMVPTLAQRQIVAHALQTLRSRSDLQDHRVALRRWYPTVLRNKVRLQSFVLVVLSAAMMGEPQRIEELSNVFGPAYLTITSVTPDSRVPFPGRSKDQARWARCVRRRNAQGDEVATIPLDSGSRLVTILGEGRGYVVVIKQALVRAGIEQNPGPIQIVAVGRASCRRKTADVMQAGQMLFCSVCKGEMDRNGPPSRLRFYHLLKGEHPRWASAPLPEETPEREQVADVTAVETAPSVEAKETIADLPKPTDEDLARDLRYALLAAPSSSKLEPEPEITKQGGGDGPDPSDSGSAIPPSPPPPTEEPHGPVWHLATDYDCAADEFALDGVVLRSSTWRSYFSWRRGCYGDIVAESTERNDSTKTDRRLAADQSVQRMLRTVRYERVTFLPDYMPVLWAIWSLAVAMCVLLVYLGRKAAEPRAPAVMLLRAIQGLGVLAGEFIKRQENLMLMDERQHDSSVRYPVEPVAARDIAVIALGTGVLIAVSVVYCVRRCSHKVVITYCPALVAQAAADSLITSSTEPATILSRLRRCPMVQIPDFMMADVLEGSMLVCQIGAKKGFRAGVHFHGTPARTRI